MRLALLRKKWFGGTIPVGIGMMAFQRRASACHYDVGGNGRGLPTEDFLNTAIEFSFPSRCSPLFRLLLHAPSKDIHRSNRVAPLAHFPVFTELNGKSEGLATRRGKAAAY